MGLYARVCVCVVDTGRTVLLTWVCMLAVAHPLANFRNNLHVMSNTLVCAEVKVINSTAKLVKLALSPINGQSASITRHHTSTLSLTVPAKRLAGKKVCFQLRLPVPGTHCRLSSEINCHWQPFDNN